MKLFCNRCKKFWNARNLTPKVCGKKNHRTWNIENFEKYISEEKINEKNPMWKGDNVGYSALHDWIKLRLKKPKFCNECKNQSPHDLANISQKYKRDLADWEWLCRRCHMKKDGRDQLLPKYNKGRQKTEEEKLIISLATRGKPKTEEWKEKVRGKKRSEETKQRMRVKALQRKRRKNGTFLPKV